MLPVRLMMIADKSGHPRDASKSQSEVRPGVTGRV